MNKRHVATVAVQFSLQPGGPPPSVEEWARHVSEALDAHKFNGSNYCQYADHNVSSVRLYPTQPNEE